MIDIEDDIITFFNTVCPDYKSSLKNNDLMLKFLSKLNLPVVTTWLATDVLYYNYPLNLGNLGRSGNRSAVYSVQESDLLLNFGSRLTTKVITNEKT